VFERTILIVTFKSNVLKELWTSGDVTLLPSTYVYDVIEILDLLDASETITDLELLGGFKIDEYQPSNWAVTVTVNSVEPIGSVTCYYKQSKAYDVDLNEYD
jgi:plasmid maintenance system killer protein